MPDPSRSNVRMGPDVNEAGPSMFEGPTYSGRMLISLSIYVNHFISFSLQEDLKNGETRLGEIDPKKICRVKGRRSRVKGRRSKFQYQ